MVLVRQLGTRLDERTVSELSALADLAEAAAWAASRTPPTAPPPPDQLR